MANHRADGRATVRKHRAVGGTHRDAALPASAVKVGVLGVLATATIAAPLAAAAAGIDESAPTDSLAQAAQEPAAPQAAAAEAAAAIAPVELPGATEAAAEVSEAALEERSDGEAASRSEERTAPAEEAGDSEGTGIEVSVPEPEPVATEEQAGAEDGESADAGSSDSGYIRPASGPITSGYGGRIHPVLGYYKGHDGVDFGAACGAPVKAAKSGTVVAVE